MQKFSPKNSQKLATFSCSILKYSLKHYYIYSHVHTIIRRNILDKWVLLLIVMLEHTLPSSYFTIKKIFENEVKYFLNRIVLRVTWQASVVWARWTLRSRVLVSTLSNICESYSLQSKSDRFVDNLSVNCHLSKI